MKRKKKNLNKMRKKEEKNHSYKKSLNQMFELPKEKEYKEIIKFNFSYLFKKNIYKF